MKWIDPMSKVNLFLNESSEGRFSSALIVKKERGGDSQFVKPTCTLCCERHYGKCLDGMSRYYGFCKNEHKVRDYPTLMSRGGEAKQAPHNGPNLDDPIKTYFYFPQATKEQNLDKDTSKL